MRYTRPAKPTAPTEQQPEAADLVDTNKNALLHIGWHFRPASFWVGVHWSTYNQRLCINLLPCVTVWVVLPGGNQP